MAELIIVGVVALGLGVTFGMISVRAQFLAFQGWRESSKSYRVLLDAQLARIATLENRLMSEDAETFAQLQHVPDELVKTVYAETQRPPESYGETKEEMLLSQGSNQGSDLEGLDLEGPTIG